MSDIFICYSRTDPAVAAKLAERLRAEGWSVFMDVQTHVGRRWHREIEKELHAARAVVVLWSAPSCDSDFVLEEAEYGKRKDLLFPAFIERVEFPYGFSRIQTADLVGWTGEPDHPGLAQLLESLRLHLHDADRSPSGSPASPPLANDLASPPLAKGGEGGFTPKAPGQTFRDKLKIGGEGPLMVVIPAGRFVMGSPPGEPGRSDSEGPQHKVRIVKPFALGVYAVTFDDYDRYCDAMRQAKPEDQSWGRENRPVINVSWKDAQAYCAWLSEQTGRTYRLPSEAEWEYACRAGSSAAYCFGDDIKQLRDYAWYGENQQKGSTHPVGEKRANAWGLHDLHGNVWEWCQDAWHGNYNGAPTDGSVWEAGGSVGRVVRGGSWAHYPANARSAYRFYGARVFRFDVFGFRVLCSAPR